MKNRKTFRKILAVIFALLMISSACMPAFAANVIYVNAGVNSIYNPYENIYGGYFRTVGGMAQPAAKNNWNIYYDVQSETLTLKDAELIMPLRILGSADIIYSESIVEFSDLAVALFIIAAVLTKVTVTVKIKLYKVRNRSV